MSARETALDRITAGTRNAELSFELVQAQLENPELLEEIPNGASVILIPDDDPALAEHNFVMAREVFARGKNVYLKHVTSASGPRVD